MEGVVAAGFLIGLVSFAFFPKRRVCINFGPVFLVLWQLWCLYVELHVYPPRGIIYTLASSKTKMHLHCIGSGGSVIIMDAGLPFFSSCWNEVLETVEKNQYNWTVCTFDRLGYGWSKEGPLPRDGESMAMELSELLNEANVLNLYSNENLQESKFIYVGWSYGGMNAQLFSLLFPNKISGLVLLDSTHQYTMNIAGFNDSLSSGITSFNVMRWLVPFGIPRILGIFFPSILPMESGFPDDRVNSSMRDEIRTIYYSYSFHDTAFKELSSFSDSISQLKYHLHQQEQNNTSPIFGSLPLVILNSNLSVDPDELNYQLQLLNYSSKSTRIIAKDSDHYLTFFAVNETINAIMTCLQMINEA